MDTNSPQKTQILGDEYDEALQRRLRTVLMSAGAKTVDKKWGMAGSQEITTAELELNGQRIIVETETYIGLSITGPSSLIDWVAAELRKTGAEGVNSL